MHDGSAALQGRWRFEKLECAAGTAYEAFMKAIWSALTPLFYVLLSVWSISAADVPRVDVILWFDTEDYLSPADDDACKRLAGMLEERHIRATFKVVGEKARVLERRGRQDVIAALRKHEIGYHANFHSVHPTPTEYLADCGLLDGMAEFERREGSGAGDVRRIFEKQTLVCYGQPGSSWASQAVAALKNIGIAPSGVPCYVDEGNHVGLDNQPFWYAGALNVYHMGPNYTRMELHDPAAVEPAKNAFAQITHRLQDSNHGGLISIFYHPCEWIHLEFWDGVNFRRGANPPRDQWKAPPQRTPTETEAAFRRFGEYLDYMRSVPGIRFVTAGELPAIYSDPVRTTATPATDLSQIASQLVAHAGEGVDFMVLGQRSYSPADEFELLALSLSRLVLKQSVESSGQIPSLLGPDGEPPVRTTPVHLEWSAFVTALNDVVAYLEKNQRVPARVFLGPDPVSPASFLIGMAKVFTVTQQSGALPLKAGVDLPAQVELLTAHRVAEDTPGLFGDWIIHKENFRAPQVLKVARLQAWTLKPAIRAAP